MKTFIKYQSNAYKFKANMDNDSLAILHDEDVINDEEFVLLYDLESSGNLYLSQQI